MNKCPRDLEVEAVGGVELVLVSGEQAEIVRGQGGMQVVGGDPPGLVCVGNPLTVERVDGAGGIPDHHPIRPDQRTHREGHRKLPAAVLSETRPLRHLPVRGCRLHHRVHQIRRVEVLPAMERRQRTNPDVDRAVPEREHPAVARHRCPGGIAQIELALQDRIGRPGRREVGAGGEAVRKPLVAHSSQGTSKARERAVGNHHHPGFDQLGLTIAAQLDT